MARRDEQSCGKPTDEREEGAEAMSINVYFKDGVEQLNEFRVVERTAKDGQRWNVYCLSGIDVFRDRGRWYSYFRDLTEPIPSIVSDFVDEITFSGRIPRSPGRAIGIYKYKDAEAELDRGDEKNTDSLWIRGRGKSMDNMLALYRMIRAGKIVPAESWEEAQVPAAATEPVGKAEVGDPTSEITEALSKTLGDSSLSLTKEETA